MWRSGCWRASQDKLRSLCLPQTPSGGPAVSFVTIEGMLRLVTPLFLCASLCLAQTSPGKPPAGVEEALKPRINQFFQFLVDSKFRQAEALVAEESKDTYYNSQKPKYLSFELKNIEYTDDFTRAKATVACETMLAIPGFAGTPLKVSVGSSWKLVNGEWMWYIDPEALHRTPFGTMTPGPGTRPPGAPAVLPTDPGFALAKVKPDKNIVNLHAGEAGEVTLTNSAPGLMSISLMGRIAGVDVKLDRVNLNAGEKAVLRLSSHSGAQSGTLSIQIEQTAEVIPIQVNIE